MPLSFNVTLKYGSLPNLSGLLVSSQDVLDGLSYQPAATAFITGIDGRDHAFVFPSLFFRDPQLPGLEYVRGDEETFELKRVLSDVSMGSGRDFAVLKEVSSGEASFVIVDHGSEYSSSGYSEWPFGHVWVATDTGDGFKFEVVSDYRAFNHAVDVGDINRDGLVDIVTSHMGVKEGGDYLPLHGYLQQTNGDFVQEIGFAQAIDGYWSSGAVAVANVNETLSPEIIQVNYIGGDGNPDWGGVRILAQDNSGNFEIASTLPRGGLFTTMGATRVIPFDYDLDGDLDLAISFEGQYASLPGKYSGNGIEIYQNDSKGGFSRVTDLLLAKNSWSFDELQWREFEAVDFDSDGYTDIILNGWWGSEVKRGSDWDLSSQMFRNVNGQEFVQLDSSSSQGLSLNGLGISTKFVRVMDTLSEGNSELFLMQDDGSVVTAQINPLYRDETEVLTVGGIGTRIAGFGGDDVFRVTGQNLHIDGGDGRDSVYYPTLRQDIDEISVSRLAVDQDTLTSVERIVFIDKGIALDLDDATSAGGIYRLYKATFNREPDTVGLGYWIAQADAGNKDAVRMAEDFVWSQEFQDLYNITTTDNYGTGTDVSELVTGFYENVLGRTPDQGGLDFYTGVIESKERTVGRVLAEISDSQENYDGTIELIANGIVFDPWVG